MLNTKKTEQNTQKYANSFEHYALPEEFPILMASLRELPGSSLQTLHFHNCLEIGLCLRGSGVVAIGGTAISFMQDDVTVIPESTPHFHASNPRTGSEWSWIVVNPVGLLSCFAESIALFDLKNVLRSPRDCFFKSAEDPAIANCVKTLIDQIDHGGSLRSVGIRSALALLLSIIRRSVSTTRESPGDAFVKPSVKLGRIVSALTMITDRDKPIPSVEEMARGCFMSVRNFQYLFRTILGKTPQEYAINYRLSMAASQLLADRQKIVDIAYENGFGSVSGFGRLFKKYMGTTPRAYRAEHARTVS